MFVGYAQIQRYPSEKIVDLILCKPNRHCFTNSTLILFPT